MEWLPALLAASTSRMTMALSVRAAVPGWATTNKRAPIPGRKRRKTTAIGAFRENTQAHRASISRGITTEIDLGWICEGVNLMLEGHRPVFLWSARLLNGFESSRQHVVCFARLSKNISGKYHTALSSSLGLMASIRMSR